jgi:phosphopantetheinyl transferase (holo-ACP synthase)
MLKLPTVDLSRTPPASFAARWVGKEAVFKSLGVAGKGAAAPLRDIEILPDAAVCRKSPYTETLRQLLVPRVSRRSWSR